MARVLLGPTVDGEKDWQVVRRKTMKVLLYFN